MQETYKGKYIEYQEHNNTWIIHEFEGEEFASLVLAREYIDKQAKAKFKRFKALVGNRLGEITSNASHNRCWFTPDIKEGACRGYGDHRQMVDQALVYPVEENKEAIAEWLAVDEEIAKALEQVDRLKSKRSSIVLNKMKVYMPHPVMFK